MGSGLLENLFGWGLSEYVPYIVYGLSFLVAFLAIFYRSEIGLLFLASVLPIFSVLDKTLKSDLPFANNIIDVLIISMVLGWLLQRGKKNQEQTIGPSPLLLSIFIFMSYSLVSYFVGLFYLGEGISSEPGLQRLAVWKNYMIMPILYMVCYYNLRSPRWKYALFFLLFFSFLIMDFKFRQSFRWVQHTHYFDTSRVSGTLGFLGPNELGSFHTIYTLFIIGLLLVDKNVWRRIAYLILILGGTYCLMYSFSRGAYFGFLGGIIFIGFIRSRKILLLCVIFLVVWKSIVPLSVEERVTKIFVEQEGANVIALGETEIDTSGRKHLWEKALNYTYQNPITGTGFNTYNVLAGHDTHNVYFKTLAEQGIIGLLIYLGLYVLAFKSGWRLYRKGGDEFAKALGFGFLCAVIGSMAVNFFGDRWTYLQLGGLYWIFWALVDQENSKLKLGEHRDPLRES